MQLIEELAEWVAGSAGPGEVRLTALPAEASTRQFFRVSTTPGRTGAAALTIAMVAPPETEDNERFVRLARQFRCHGLATPEIHAVDLARGFVLMEDLGEVDFAAAYRAGEVDRPLDAAVRALAKLQTMPVDGIPPYTTMRFGDEITIFTEWLIDRFLELDVPEHFAALRQSLIDATQSVPMRVIHRDYHCRNLIWRADGSVGMVDFQDALVGPACYDIASLLRDCYTEFDEDQVVRWRRHFLGLADLGCAEAVFNRAFDLTAIQRQLKAVGIFARLFLTRGRGSHLDDIVPVLGRIAKLGLMYPETAALSAWLARDVVPAAARRIEQLS